MDKFVNIISYIKDIIKDTRYEGRVFTVGGSVRDFVMGNKVKDIDIVVDIENGGIEFANFCMKKGLLIRDPVIFERYGVASFRFKTFPDEDTCGKKNISPPANSPLIMKKPCIFVP